MGLEVEVVGDTNKFDIIAIGGGIAGMTASCVVTQKGLKSCFLERIVPGGKLMHIKAIHNVEGMDGVPGKNFAEAIFKQATEEVKTTYVFGNVKYIRQKNDLFYIFTEDGQTFEAKAIIIAAGSIPRPLLLNGSDVLDDWNLLSYCVLCDAVYAKNKTVILAGSTAHLDHLKQYAKEVITMKAEDIKDIIGEGQKIKGIITTKGEKIKCDGIFVENGHMTFIEFLPSDFKVNKNNELEVNDKMHTSVKGAFAAGDCTNNTVKTIPLALDQATIAAEEAVKYVKSRKW